MGLFDFLSGEFIEVIAWTDDTRDTMVWRFETRGNAIKYGAKLTVREGQAAVFVHEGQIADVFGALGTHWDGLDGLVHSIAFAPKDALAADFLSSVTRENFRVAHEISAYSVAALAKAALPMMEGRPASLLTLSYLGAVRSVPNYNVMGLAKASLESAVYYMAQSLGPKGIRVNAVSAGPIKTLAASGISNFGEKLDLAARYSPLRRGVTIEEVGNAAAFLLSDLASGITGEITYVDAGFNTTTGGHDDPA